MVQMTAFAAVMAAVLFAQTMSMGGLVLVSTVLQATAVVNVPLGIAGGQGVAAYGVSPYMFMALVAGLVWLWRLGQSRRLLLPQHLRWPLGFLLAYLGVAALGAWLLPIWFAAMPVNLLVEPDAIDKLSPLRATLSNLVQTLNLVVHVSVLLFLLQAAQQPNGLRGIKAGVVGALVLVLAIGFYEQWARSAGWPSMLPFWGSNAGYAQAGVVDYGVNINGNWKLINPRIGLPFSEPSYLSTYLAATTVGLWAVALLGRGWWWAWLAAVLSTLGLINTLGSTGWAATGVAMSALCLWVLGKALRPSTRRSHRLRASVLGTLLVLTGTGGVQMYSQSDIKPKVDAIVNHLIVDKIKQKDGVRELSNKRALEIVQETYGLGVGMGSNRASSFMASLVSNTGVLGALLFCSMLASLLWRYIKAPQLTDMQIFVATALPTATLAMSLGIPDLNLPMYWGFIFLAFIFCPEPSPSKSGS
ncbi:hypothetical protein [Limnohabitans sp. 2KL-51]|uniref:hypothetical protein n=1 Tax=Limnohabitans sp. 2KL-51 TaxID=1977911 RepID=UPI000D34EA4C|nr:hypothetical protein [Limnohabitans sp. 2KL-51]PUE47635.1 hypothetical protein B9Z49_09665 [Limnohabitans sp. 2KL-51]